MSEEELEKLVERLTGEKLLSDQTMWQQVVAQAAAISQQWATETPEGEPLKTAAQVDCYEPQTAEVLVVSDAIQVK